MVADLGQAVFEHAGDQPAGRVVASTQAALVHHLSRPEILIAAETL